MDPPIPCELVRGYLDFMPHAWNVILRRRGDSLIRMVVDACHPHDIREETDPEYFCRLVLLFKVVMVMLFHLICCACGCYSLIHMRKSIISHNIDFAPGVNIFM